MMQLYFIIICDTCMIIHLDIVFVYFDRISVNFDCDNTIHNNAVYVYKSIILYAHAAHATHVV